MYAVLNSKTFLVLVAMFPLKLCPLPNNCYIKDPFSSSPGLDGILFIFLNFLKKISVHISSQTACVACQGDIADHRSQHDCDFCG